ncbi:tungstate transport system permease protein [Paucimonas lemoignei]|uniref:Tungstate transport system permease protein n=1 Tax=Paucimonas lemoignei TaxID=29443 RepID=A0A4R3HV97_PAULE|nr:ABC transporter permease [Paucimonas lemoignei]TCS35985.1 tungstate transport system permease protein [Paucimonas lemoignei]
MSILAAIRDAFSLLFSGDAALLEIIGVSLKTSLVALVFAAPLAIGIGYAIAQHDFPGRRIAIWLTQASMAMPTVLIGLLLYLTLSRQGPLGELEWLFAQSGVIVGQILIALPVLTAFSLAAIQAVDPRIAETAVTLGASRLAIMRTVLHEVRFGVMAAIISGFGRVIAEVGCALMVGGNIKGETRTITTAIALETSKGEFAQGIALGIVLVSIALLINALLVWLQGDTRLSRSAT